MFIPAFVFFLILKAALTHAAEVVGYQGETVVLPSGADPAWNLSKIEWSTFHNSTHIAVYSNGVKKLNRTRQFHGRLELDAITGDLTIHRVTKDDAMEYSVRLMNSLKNNDINKRKLTVRQHLHKPSVETHVSAYEDGRCAVTLNCWSLDDGVDFSWETAPPVAASVVASPDNKSSFLVAFLRNATERVEFTCTSNRTWERTSSSVTPNCVADVTPPTHSCQICCNCRYGACVSVSLIGGFCTALVLVYAARRLQGKLCPSASYSLR